MHNKFYEIVSGIQAKVKITKDCTLIGHPGTRNWKVKKGTVLKAETTGYAWDDSIGYHLFDIKSGRGGYFQVPRDCAQFRHFPPDRNYRKRTQKYIDVMNKFLAGKGPMPR